MDISVEKELLREIMKDLLETMERHEARSEKRFWKKINIPSSFSDLLGGLTKEQMRKICQSYSFKRLSSLRKAELAEKLVELVPERFAKTLDVLDQGRYSLLKAAANNQGVLKGTDLETAKAELLLASYLVFPGSCNGERVLYMPPEITEQFIRADGAKLKKTIKRNTEWITLTHGMLHYYGLMGIKALSERIEQLTGERIDYLEFTEVLIPAVEYYELVRHTAHGLCDRRVSDTKELFNEHRSRANLDYYSFTKKQLSRAGTPGYIDRTPALNTFLKFLSEFYDLTEGEKNKIALQLIEQINRGENLEGMIDHLGRSLGLSSFEFVELLVAKIVELHNNTRQWILKGHTPTELSQEEEKRLKPLPAEPFAVKQAEPEVFDLKTLKKIGRNDPCPCGSGKKFKRCCGR